MRFCIAIDRSFLLGVAVGVGLHIVHIQTKYSEKRNAASERAPETT
jgi:hypothetical protein